MSREIEAGQIITLYAEFYILDDKGNKVLTDPDETPLVSIFDAFHDPRVSSDLEADALVYQQSATKVTTGIWKYNYSVPTDVMSNFWFDYWEAVIDGIEGEACMQFFVIGEDVDEQILTNNLLVTVTIDSSIEDMEGNVLPEDYTFSFLTNMSPMYSDPKLLKTFGGSWVSSIDDSQLIIFCYLASLDADLITPKYIRKYSPVFLDARKNYVTYNALYKLLSLPYNVGGQTKQLADLMVKKEGNSFIDMINRIESQMKLWEAVVNAGGNIGPGESLPVVIGMKGINDPDRRNIGRLWIEPAMNESPLANGKVKPSGKNRWYFDRVS